MPLSRYDRFFGGRKGSAAKAHAAMVAQYGEKKAEEVFYATKNRNARKGKNPFFGSSLPFELGREGGPWFAGARPSAPSSFTRRGK